MMLKTGPICDVAICSRPTRGRNPRSHRWCQAHYDRWIRTGDVRADEPLQSWRRADEVLHRDPLDRKRCTGCKQWLPESRFQGVKGKTADGLQYDCKGCDRARRHGVTDEFIRDLFDSQGGRCVIDGRPLGEDYVVDHNHKCCPGRSSCGGCIRGLLCRNCNIGLGQFRESPAVLQAALAYLLGAP